MARSTVIQGTFPAGFSRMAAPQPPHMRPAAPAWVQQRIGVRPAAPVHAPVQRHVNPAAPKAFPLPPNLQNFSTAGGQPLPPEVRQKMEGFFGASFADVRIHVGPQAGAIGALAFTQGTDIHFAPGQYNPRTPQGQQILGHELAHVVQQRSGRVRNPFGSGVAVVQDQMLEAEADRMGHRAAAHRIPVQAKLARHTAPPTVAAYRHTIQRAALVLGGVRHSARIASAIYNHTVLGIVKGVRKFFQTVDKHGNYYWNGRRGSLSWTAVTKAAMAASKANGCAIGGCTNAASGIDHITDFATTQSALATNNYCDGTDHWDGVPWQDAQDDYNNLANLQWACTSCNSSKSGARGLYTPPTHVGACPGAACAL